MPGYVRTYAPQAQTLVLQVPETRDHLAAIRGVTADGRLLQRVQDHAVNGVDVVCFLKHLLAQMPGKLLIIWDGGPIHRGQPVKDVLAGGAARRLRLEALPHLWHELRQAVARLRQKPRILHAAIPHAGYG